MTQAQPSISVIMPVYHSARYVAAAVQSVLDQTLPDFELIIVDDGGTDDSVAICRRFSDPRIRIIYQENRGLAGARNTGIAAAHGHYIALLDSDDLWLPGKLAAHAAHLQANPHVGASYAGAELVDEQGHWLGIRQQPKLGHVTPKDVFCGRAICNGSTPVFRMEMLTAAVLKTEAGGRCWYFDESLRRCEDVECWTRLALRSPLRFAALPGCYTLYRISAASLSADAMRQLSAWEDACAKIAAFAPDFIDQHRAEARARALRYLARRCVFMRDRARGLVLILEAISTSPGLLWREPVKTGVTLAACAALRALPPAGFTRLARLARPQSSCI